MSIMIIRALALFLFTSTMVLHAQVPQLINYQGRVAVGQVNFDGSGQFKFALVNAGGTTTYWSNDGTSNGGSEPASSVALMVSKGLYSVAFGDTSLANMTTLPASVFTNEDVRLRVWFDDGSNGSQLLTPDQRIGAVGYAMVAGGLQPGADINTGSVYADSVRADSVNAGTVNATAFSGSGAGLTDIPAGAVAPPPPGMVLIPAGAFLMGDSLDGSGDAIPVNTTVSAFYMDVNEVSFSQWQSVYYWATSNGYAFSAGQGKGPNHPVHSVTWYDVVKWCNARSEQAGKTPVYYYYTTGGQITIYKSGNVDLTNANVKRDANGYRLPTEAEWEKAARGGLSGQRFPSGNTITQNLANYFGDTATYAYDRGPNGVNATGSVGGTNPATSPVGTFAANGYGLNDMAGNLYEWCWDRFGTPYAGGIDPTGPDSGSNRVVRGGSWVNGAGGLRCAQRNSSGPSLAGNHVGFRAVLAPGQP